jgi:2-haloacid dehalogenase
MLEKLGERGIGKDKILHTAESLFHDHQPANEFGLASCWIYRRHAKQGFGATMNPGSPPKVDFRFNSMAELVKAHQEAVRQKL